MYNPLQKNKFNFFLNITEERVIPRKLLTDTGSLPFSLVYRDDNSVFEDTWDLFKSE